MIIVPTNLGAKAPVSIRSSGIFESAYNGTTSVFTPPTHQAGDLIVVAGGEGSNGGISAPAGWTIVAQSGGYMTLCYKWAISSSETFGTWTQSSDRTILACVVVASANKITPFGASAVRARDFTSNVDGSNYGNFYTPAITQQKTDGSSIRIHLAIGRDWGSRACSWGGVPSGYTDVQTSPNSSWNPTRIMRANSTASNDPGHAYGYGVTTGIVTGVNALGYNGCTFELLN